MAEEDFTIEVNDLPPEKYKELEKLLFEYCDGNISREDYVIKVEKLLEQ